MTITSASTRWALQFHNDLLFWGEHNEDVARIIHDIQGSAFTFSSNTFSLALNWASSCEEG